MYVYVVYVLKKQNKAYAVGRPGAWWFLQQWDEEADFLTICPKG